MKHSKKPAGTQDNKERLEHYNAVLLEDIRSQMKLSMEYNIATRETLEKRFDDMESKMNQRFEIVEGILMHHSELIEHLDSKMAENTAAIRNLDSRVTENTAAIKNLDSRMVENTAAIRNLDSKMTKNIEECDRSKRQLSDHERRLTQVETDHL